MSDSTLETLLRRDRLIVAGALGVVVALAWGYVLWLANDMDMGGMDMTGLRMIPAGIGIHHDACNCTMESDRVRVCIRDVGRDDDWNDGTLGRTHDFDVRPGGPAGQGQWQAVRPNRLVRHRLFPRRSGFRWQQPLSSG